MKRKKAIAEAIIWMEELRSNIHWARTPEIRQNAQRQRDILEALVVAQSPRPPREKTCDACHRPLSECPTQGKLLA